MDNQISNAQNLNMSQLNALSNVKDLGSGKSNYLHIVVLLLMVVFSIFIVGLSIYNFEGLINNKNIKVVHAQEKHAKDLQTLTNQ
ncbi:MAG TPA: hypothetical protein VES68_01475 [Candidatus Sulfotelmatobacter sp.]|nr:hypothetical protein [Candidatus Sulfotelmatobacter sp.]